MCLQTVCLIAGIACFGADVFGHPSAVVTVQIANPSNMERENVPVTFGQVFRQGDIKRGIVMRAGEQMVPAQIDVKRHYDDGSVRFAIISMVLKNLPAGEKLTLALCDGPMNVDSRARTAVSEVLDAGFDAVVKFSFPDGTKSQISAKKLLREARDDEALWLRGLIATEWIVSGPPVDDAGNLDPDLNVQFLIRVYPECGAIRVSVMTENCWDHWAEAMGYDVAVVAEGRDVFSRKGVQHRRLSRWRKTFWIGNPAPHVHITHDLDYMSSTGALPRYDTSLEVPPSDERTERLLRMEGPSWEIMGRGALTAYMPTTGGREEIAPYPSWTVKYLLTMDPRYKALVLASGDLAGAWPIHVRARHSGRIMTLDDRPEFWLDSRGKDKPAWKPPRNQAGIGAERLSPDLAHQGSFAYVPYLVTGDYFYLEEAYFWANFCLLATWPHPRQNERGILSGQVRGNAWALRNIADAAAIAPDDDPELAYFDEKIRNNIRDRSERMYRPPAANPLGFWHLRTTEDARIQNPADPRWMVIAPWEHDYLIWSFHHLVELGYPDAAKPRDSLLRWRVGTLTNTADFDPAMAAPYRMVVGRQTEDDQIIYYDDWKTLAAENARLYEPEMPNYGNSYAYSARAAVVCGVDGGFPKASEALQQIERLLPNHRQVMARQPFWAIQVKSKSR
jgi:hypothetical protein